MDTPFTSHSHRLEAYRRRRSDNYAIDFVLEKFVELISGDLCTAFRRQLLCGFQASAVNRDDLRSIGSNGSPMRTSHVASTDDSDP